MEDWPCILCHTWGATVTREQCPVAVCCPSCYRLTWPNLGVNMPAGAAVSLGGSSFGMSTLVKINADTGRRVIFHGLRKVLLNMDAYPDIELEDPSGLP